MSRVHLTLVVVIVLVLTVGLNRSRPSRAAMSPPTLTANPDSYTLHNNGTIGSVLTNDTGSGSLSAYLVTTPVYGSVNNYGNGMFLYARGGASFTGTDSFTYKACDTGYYPMLCSSPATVTINVVNQAPTAVNDSYIVHGTMITIGAFMANDSDPDGDSLTYTRLTNPAHGSLTVINQSDMPKYTPYSGYTGADSFTYKVCDQFTACSTATVSLTVNNLPPLANADFFIVHQGSTNIGPMKGNDYDPDGEPLPSNSFTMIVPPANGTIYGLSDPPYPLDWKRYVPNAGFTGTDSWQYRICDDLGLCSTGNVYILVLPGPGPTIKVPYACGCPMDPGVMSLFPGKWWPWQKFVCRRMENGWISGRPSKSGNRPRILLSQT
jgi:hypothetical protein